MHPKIIIPVFFSLFLIPFFNSCKKNSVQANPAPPASLITISSVVPNTGKHGDTIIIIGTHFNLSPGDDTVRFNGKKAIVQKATADTLFVLVPLGAGTGAVSVNSVPSPGPVFQYIPVVTVSTLAGSGMQKGTTGGILGGYLDGPDTLAKFNDPFALATDGNGNIYVSDLGNNRVRLISAGRVSTVAGSGFYGFIDGTDSLAGFFGPYGIAVDALGEVLIADGFSHRIRKISGGQVTTFAGTGVIGSANGVDTLAQFYDPLGLSIDGSGNIYVVEVNDVRRINASGIVSTLAGSNSSGYLDGPDTTARFNNPIGVAFDRNGNVYVADNINKRIRKINTAGLVTTFAGNGMQGLHDGPADSAQFFLITGIAVDVQDNIYVTDQNCIRKITPDGTVSTFAGAPAGGLVDGPVAVSQFYQPEGLAFDNQGNLYVADTGNSRIRKITFE